MVSLRDGFTDNCRQHSLVHMASRLAEFLVWVSQLLAGNRLADHCRVLYL